jgi:hypothetical protein
MTENKQAQELIITIVDGNSNPIQGSEIRISEGSFDSFIISDENGEATTPIPSTLNGVDVKCQHPTYEGKLIRLLLNGQDATSTIQLSDDPKAQLDISITHDKERSATEDQPVSAEELVDEFEQVGNQLEKRPTRSEFEKHSQFEADDVYDHFDSWYGIVQAAEINSATRQDLLHELYRLKKELGVPPLAAQIKEDGRFSAYDYQMEFGSMEEALEKIGIDIKSTLLHEIVRIIHDSDDEPTLADFSELTPYSQGAIYKWFNSWEEAIDTAKGQQASAIPSFNDGDVGEYTLIRNELSELYELVRNLRMLTNTVVQVRNKLTNDGTAGSTDPMDGWAKKVDKFWNGKATNEPGYKSQQTNRNPFSMIEYRQKYGNGDRITEFEHASARQVTPAVAALISSYVYLDTESIYLPVDPENSVPIPVIVESEDALRSASNMLQRLPSRPDAAISAEFEDTDSNIE